MRYKKKVGLLIIIKNEYYAGILLFGSADPHDSIIIMLVFDEVVDCSVPTFLPLPPPVFLFMFLTVPVCVLSFCPRRRPLQEGVLLLLACRFVSV